MLLDENEKWENLPAPFIQEGYWADYDNLKESFKDEWNRLEDTNHPFLKELWNSRSISKVPHICMVRRQLLRLHSRSTAL